MKLDASWGKSVCEETVQNELRNDSYQRRISRADPLRFEN